MFDEPLLYHLKILLILNQKKIPYKGVVIFTAKSKCKTNIKIPLITKVKAMILHLLKKVKVIDGRWCFTCKH